MTAARFVVGGRVQGVFFRAGTREQAQRLGLRGYARNRADGRVGIQPFQLVNASLWRPLPQPRGQCIDCSGSTDRQHVDPAEAGADFTIG